MGGGGVARQEGWKVAASEGKRRILRDNVTRAEPLIERIMMQDTSAWPDHRQVAAVCLADRSLAQWFKEARREYDTTANRAKHKGRRQEFHKRELREMRQAAHEKLAKAQAGSRKRPRCEGSLVLGGDAGGLLGGAAETSCMQLSLERMDVSGYEERVDPAVALECGNFGFAVLKQRERFSSQRTANSKMLPDALALIGLWHGSPRLATLNPEFDYQVIKSFQTACSHPHVAQIDTVDAMRLVVFHGVETDLACALRSKVFGGDETARLLCGCLKAASYLHEKDIVHRGVGLRSILLSPEPASVRLSGFENASQLVGGTSVGRPNCEFPAPEMEACDPYTGAVDLWAIGCVAVRALTGEAREAWRYNSAMLSNVVCSPALRDVMSVLLQDDPSRRQAGAVLWKVSAADVPEHVDALNRLVADPAAFLEDHVAMVRELVALRAAKA
jgi:hypothetical protein